MIAEFKQVLGFSGPGSVVLFVGMSCFLAEGFENIIQKNYFGSFGQAEGPSCLRFESWLWGLRFWV